MMSREHNRVSCLLVTANARYSHTALGLRSLAANLGPYADVTEIMEFTLDDRPSDMVERILSLQPRVVGLGVYIWNSELMVEVAHQLRQVAENIVIIAGGPEVRFDVSHHPILEAVDCVVQGEGETVLPTLLERVLIQGKPLPKTVAAPLPDLAKLVLPYGRYTTDDLRHRVIYVEASRGCPFRCAFCLSALDRTVRRFPEDAVIAALSDLYDRGVRQFKFVDRALHLGITPKLLDFFLEKSDEDLFVHFELVPDRLPSELLDKLLCFRPGRVQVEAGIQTLDEAVAARIGRKQDAARALMTLVRLREEGGVHIHADLVAGLPGETLEAFRRGFDRLFDLYLHEIQVGILKRLPGAPIAEFDEAFGMVYNRKPPYEILKNAHIDFQTMQHLKRFARVFDLVANRGHFVSFVPFLVDDGSPFDRFWHLADWLFAKAGRTHAVALNRLATLLFEYAVDVLKKRPDEAANRLYGDFAHTGRRSFPGVVDAHVTERAPSCNARPTGLPKRQARHLGEKAR